MLFIDEIKKVLFTDKGRLNSRRIEKLFKWVKSYNIDLYDFLIEKSLEFSTSNSSEIIFRLLKNVENLPVCPVCGRNTKFVTFTKGYNEFCSNLCSYKSNDVKQRIKQTNIERYGAECSFSNKDVQEKYKQTMLERYGVEFPLQNEDIKKKLENTNIDRYGVTHASKTKEFHEKIKKTSLEKYGTEKFQNLEYVKVKAKETCIKKYGVENPSQNKNVKRKKKDTFLEHYGVENISQSNIWKEKIAENIDKIQEKIYNTKKKNKTFNTSKAETKLLSLLKEKFVEIKTQYKSEQYPFTCDFYIPSLDLYIEFQGSWTHGKEPFDENNEEHLKLLEHWTQKSEEVNFKDKKKSYYKKSIEVWSILDVEKRKHAKINDLNWKEFFTIEQFKGWLNEQI